MKIAFISDIHSNLEALTEVLNQIEKHSVDQIVCLGDIIGYGPNPSECIKLIREKCSIVVVGNHDHAAVGLTDKEYFNLNAKQAIEWTMEQLSEEELMYLASLPYIEKLNRIIFSHSSLFMPEDWGYVLDEDDAEFSFRQMNAHDLCFIGHSHIPLVFEKYHHSRFLGYVTHLNIDEKRKYIINVGSVGQPRDGIPESTFVIYDDKKKVIDLFRTQYDIKITQKKIIDKGLPKFLSERLSYGR